MKGTERQRQQAKAKASGSPVVFEFRCADGVPFRAVAATEAGAFRVLNAERLHGELQGSRPALPADLAAVSWHAARRAEVQKELASAVSSWAALARLRPERRIQFEQQAAKSAAPGGFSQGARVRSARAG